LARNFRVYEKKRGHRRTGSRKLGSAGEALFFAVFFLLGCGGLVALFTTLVVPEWRVNHEFVQHTCTVLGTRIAEKAESDGGTVYRPEIQIEYLINGETYVSWTYDIHNSYSGGRDEKQAILNQFVVGAQYRCWYNPADSKEVVLVRGYNWWVWLLFIVPISFVLIGGGGFIYSALHLGRSAEYRAATTRRMVQPELFDRHGQAGADFPNVPTGANMTNSPGTKLAFRLPIATSPAWALFTTLLACLMWNGIVSVFLVIAVSGHLEGEPDWFLTVFIVPFVLIGVGLVVIFIRQLLVTSGIGPTLLEISDHPLYPAGRYRLFLSQFGRLKMNSLEILLVCEEEARYRQGTDTRTETRRMYQEQMFLREGFTVRRGEPFEADCEFAIPGNAMHSFKSDNNEINWKLLVKGNVEGWPDYQRTFPVIVYPNVSGSSNP